MQIPNYLQLLLHNRSLRRHFERFFPLPLSPQRSSYRCNKWNLHDVSYRERKTPFYYLYFCTRYTKRYPLVAILNETRKLWFWISTKMVDGGELQFVVSSWIHSEAILSFDKKILEMKKQERRSWNIRSNKFWNLFSRQFNSKEIKDFQCMWTYKNFPNLSLF